MRGQRDSRTDKTIANATQLKFGYPDTLIADYEHWCVLLRPAQATLGAMVLVCKDDAQSFAELSPQAYTELGVVVPHIEVAARALCSWDKINYLMLMMVDPDVHFHVLPRYAEQQEFQGTAYPDPGWPGPPDLASAVKLDPEQISELTAALKAGWPE